MRTGTRIADRIISIVPLWWLSGTVGGGGVSGSGSGPERSLPLAGRKVLVVEDEFFVGMELAQTLEAAGADIAGPAWSLADAEHLAAEGGIDMAVVDVNLNGEYSLDFAVGLRKAGVHVVFATAHADDTHLFRGEAGNIPRLSKPTSARALLRMLLPDA